MAALAGMRAATSGTAVANVTSARHDLVVLVLLSDAGPAGVTVRAIDHLVRFPPERHVSLGATLADQAEATVLIFPQRPRAAEAGFEERRFQGAEAVEGDAGCAARQLGPPVRATPGSRVDAIP